MTDQEGQTEQTQEQEQVGGRFSEPPIEQIRQLKMRIETLEKELADEREKATDYMNRAMRAQADVSNVRKRLQQDLALAMKEALKSVIYEQLAVLDSFDRAFSSLPNEFRHFSWVEGMGLIQTQLFSILHRTGVTPIEVIKGKQYNPIEHEVVAYEETGDYPEEAVTAELQRGYKLQEQVLRPALVKIARTPQTAATGATGATDNATENTTTTTTTE